MTLFTRIAGTEPDRGGESTKISPHLMTAVMNLFDLGNLTSPQALAAFDPVLDATEQAEATDVFNAIGLATYDRQFACDIFYLTEIGIAPYDAEAQFKTDLVIT